MKFWLHISTPSNLQPPERQIKIYTHTDPEIFMIEAIFVFAWRGI